jgi:hypothetical protein
MSRTQGGRLTRAGRLFYFVAAKDERFDAFQQPLHFGDDRSDSAEWRQTRMLAARSHAISEMGMP